MKSALAFLVVFYLLKGTDASVKNAWMTQRVDNFNDKDKATWEMHYMINDEYFEDGGPIFIFIGGQVPLSEAFMKKSLVVDMATEHHGILFCPDHRFYGKSRVGKSLETENLKFLTVQQALADLANFIQTLRSTDPRLANSKVIIAGCSYAGSLAVWFSRLYPHLVQGTWAVSAPILVKVEFPEFLEVVGKAIKVLHSPDCYNRIQEGMKELQTMFFSDRAKEVPKILHLCSDFDYKNIEDVWSFFRAIHILFGRLVSYHKTDEVQKACDFLMNYPDGVSAIANYFIKHYTPKAKECKSVSSHRHVFFYKNTSYDNIFPRPWMYQVCNELGWFQVATSQRQPFGTLSPVNLDFKRCFDIFGADFTEELVRKKIDQFSKEFGGLKQTGKNIFMTYGSLDPWTPLGPGESDISTVVPKYTHCAHINSISGSDTTEMVASKKRLLAKVHEWLK